MRAAETTELLLPPLSPLNSLISRPQKAPFSLQRELNSFHSQGKSSTLPWVGGWSVSSQPLICLAHAKLGGGRWGSEIPDPNNRAGSSVTAHAEGEVLDERDPWDCSEPQFWLCWEQDEHMDCCRALGLPWESSGLPEPWQQAQSSPQCPKSMGSCSACWVEELHRARRAPARDRHGQVRRRELLTFPSCSSPPPVPHLPILLLHLPIPLLTFSSCSSSRAGSCASCSRIPAGRASLPPPAARRGSLVFCCCFFAASSFVFPFFPFFPLSSLVEPADCGDTAGQGC